MMQGNIVKNDAKIRCTIVKNDASSQVNRILICELIDDYIGEDGCKVTLPQFMAKFV